MSLSITQIIDGERSDEVDLLAIDYQPVHGLVLRLADARAGIKGLASELEGLLKGSPFRIWRACCNSAPTREDPHAEGCENVEPQHVPPKKGKAQ